MLLSASFVAFLSIISIGSTEEEEEACDYTSLKAVGSLQPFGCVIVGVHVSGEYIYVFCQNEFYSNPQTRGLLSYQYERRRPFGLVSLILAFDIAAYQLYQSHHSEISNCFYIYEGLSNIWKIGLDDHSVTEFLSNDKYILSLSSSSNGQLFILAYDYAYRVSTLNIYASDAELIKTIELPLLANWIFAILTVLVGEENVFIAGDYLDTRNLELWIGLWIRNRDGRWDEKRKGNFIQEGTNDDPQEEYFDFSSKMIFVCEKELTSNVSKPMVSNDYDDYNYFTPANNYDYDREYSNPISNDTIVLVYPCINHTSWCRRTLRNCERTVCNWYGKLHETKDKLFIKLVSTRGTYSNLMIYTVK